MSKAILKSLALLGALAVSSGAYAAPVTVEVSNQSSSNAWTAPFNDNGYITGVTLTDTRIGGAGTVSGVGVGAFDLQDNPSTLGEFVAFCVDIANTLHMPGYYNLVDANGAGSMMPSISGVTVGYVQALFNTSYKNVSEALGTPSQSAGFQLALWEVLFESEGTRGDPFGWSLTSGSLQATGIGSGTNTAGGAAADMLQATADYLANGTKGTGYQEYTLTFLQSAKKDGSLRGNSQNLVTAAPVPVPAAGLLLLAGLAGLGAVARKRKAA